MFRRSNIATKIFGRQVDSPAPGTSVHCARQFYENIIPGYSIYDIQCPNNSPLKFSNDGQYLISVSRNMQDLVVYRPTWLSYSYDEEDCGLPERSNKFKSFFSQQYSVTLASTNELMCKDFFLCTPDNKFGLFATFSVPFQRLSGGPVQGMPYVEKTTFHLLRLKDGVIMDVAVFRDDFVDLTHQGGVCLCDDHLSIVSVLYQTIHIFQIKESGYLVYMYGIGSFCREDDSLYFHTCIEPIAVLERNKIDQISLNHRLGDNLPEPFPENCPLSGFKQRLISFIFRKILNEEMDKTLKVQCLRNFYFHYHDYLELIMVKAQFLDHEHLLIKLGTMNEPGLHDIYNPPSFFAVYNIITSEIVSFYQDFTDCLRVTYERFCDHFRATLQKVLYVKLISCPTDYIYVHDKLWSNKKYTSSSQIVKKMLVSLLLSSKTQCSSPYLDPYLFLFDEKMISSDQLVSQAVDIPFKFFWRRKPKTLKFTIKTGPKAWNSDAGATKMTSYLFHPFLPLILSVQQEIPLGEQTVNIHFRR